MSDGDLTRTFLAHLPDARAAGVDLDPALRAMVAGARAAWPELHVPDADFLAYVAARVAGEAPLLEQLDELRGPDLYLACACVRGDAQAIAAFDRAYLADLASAGARAGFPAALVDEVRQVMREILLVGEAPRLLRYNGRGELRNWVRVVATREALQILRRTDREVPTGDADLGDVLQPETDLERGYLRGVSKEQLGAALTEALRSLGSRDRNLLRYHYLDRLTLEQLSTMYRVHRATIARQLARARELVLARTREHLRAQVGSESQVDSILRLAVSDLDLTLRTALEQSPRAAGRRPRTGSL